MFSNMYNAMENMFKTPATKRQEKAEREITEKRIIEWVEKNGSAALKESLQLKEKTEKTEFDRRAKESVIGNTENGPTITLKGEVFIKDKLEPLWVERIRIYEQEDFVKGYSTRDGMVNMQSSINEYLGVISRDVDKRLVAIIPTYAATDDANFHMVYTIHYQVDVRNGDL